MIEDLQKVQRTDPLICWSNLIMYILAAFILQHAAVT